MGTLPLIFILIDIFKLTFDMSDIMCNVHVRQEINHAYDSELIAPQKFKIKITLYT